jgi:hypothetical protein
MKISTLRKALFLTLTIFLLNAISSASGMSINDFFDMRPDVRDNIRSWSGQSDPEWILREWVKITTERGQDYKTAKEILAGSGKKQESKEGQSNSNEANNDPSPAPSPAPAPARSNESAGGILDRLGVKVNRYNGQEAHWRLVDIKWLNEAESGGRHHIYIEKLEENGNKVAGPRVGIGWPSGETFVEKDFPMFSAGNPYRAWIDDGIPSDVVEGMGLGTPDQRQYTIHVCYELKFQKIPAQTPEQSPEQQNLPTDGFP